MAATTGSPQDSEGKLMVDTANTQLHFLFCFLVSEKHLSITRTLLLYSDVGARLLTSLLLTLK